MLALATADASFVLPQYPVCRLREVFSDKIRLHGPLCRVPSEFTFTIASTDEDATRARVSRKFHVAITIANYKRAPQVEHMLRSRTFQHAGFWLRSEEHTSELQSLAY